MPDLKSFEPAALEPLPPTPKGKPSSKIDLSHWKLTLPLPAEEPGSAKKNKPLEISAKRLSDGYAHADYFHLDSRGAIEFWCPVTGVPTENTKYPRTELREVLDPRDDNVCWSTAGVHTLAATCRVVQVPSSQKVIIGQIHGFSGAAKPLVKLQYSKGRIEALVKKRATGDKGSEDKELKLSFPEVGLNHEFDYEIKLKDGLLSVSVHDQTHTVNILESDAEWARQSFYFKAGVYVQDNEGSSSEGARAIFYKLNVHHAP